LIFFLVMLLKEYLTTNIIINYTLYILIKPQGLAQLVKISTSSQGGHRVQSPRSPRGKALLVRHEARFPSGSISLDFSVDVVPPIDQSDKERQREGKREGRGKKREGKREGRRKERGR